jgi:hypothetical protein
MATQAFVSRLVPLNSSSNDVPTAACIVNRWEGATTRMMPVPPAEIRIKAPQAISKRSFMTWTVGIGEDLRRSEYDCSALYYVSTAKSPG